MDRFNTYPPGRYRFNLRCDSLAFIREYRTPQGAPYERIQPRDTIVTRKGRLKRGLVGGARVIRFVAALHQSERLMRPDVFTIDRDSPGLLAWSRGGDWLAAGAWRQRQAVGAPMHGCAGSAVPRRRPDFAHNHVLSVSVMR